MGHARAPIVCASFFGAVSTLFMTTNTHLAEPADEVTEPGPRLGELLVQAGKLSSRDLDRALSAQQEMGGMLGRVLVRLGLVSDGDVAGALARQLGVPLVQADGFPDLMPEVEGLLPEFLQAHAIYPLRLENGVLNAKLTSTALRPASSGS